MRALLILALLVGSSRAGIISGGGPSDALSAATAAGTYVQKAGDTMTGRLTAPDATLTYGLTAATGSFSGSVTVGSMTSTGAASVTGAFAVASATFTVATTGIVSAPSQPTAIIKTDTAQNIANATEIYFGAQDYLNNGMHSISASSSSVTIPAGGAGKYMVTCNLTYESGAGSYRGVNISVDGASISGPLTPPVSGAYTQVVFTKLYSLSAGQVIKCKSFHDQATLNMCSSNQCRLEVVKLW